MRTRQLFVLLALLFPAVLSAQSVTLGEPQSLEGVTRHVTDAMEMDMIMSVEAEGGNQDMNISQSKTREYKEEIQAMEDGVILKRKVSISKAFEKDKSPMRNAKETTPPVTDAVYIIERTEKDGEPSWNYTREDGKGITKDETDFLADEFAKDKSRGFAKVLQNRTLSVGETVQLSEEDLATFQELVGDKKNKMKSASVTLTGVREVEGKQLAQYDLDATMVGSSPAFEFEIAIKGKADVFVESVWLHSLKIEGDITGAGSHAGASITADGMMSGKRKISYE